MTTIYVQETTIFLSNYQKLEVNLPKNILDHCKKHLNETEYIQSLLGWNMLLNVLKENNIDPNKIRIKYNKSKKPLIDDVYFNISHSNRLVAVAYSDRDVGIDIQNVDLSKDYISLAKSTLNPHELRLYLSSKNKPEEYTKLWSKKEAYYKMIGTGIIMKKIKQDLPYLNIYTKQLKDSHDDIYYLSCDTFNDENISLVLN